MAKDPITEEALRIVTWAYGVWREYMRVFSSAGWGAVEPSMLQQAIEVEQRLEEIHGW
jgi:hypothetical protein